MAVMNGFRKELFNKILGLNGHIIVNKVGARLRRLRRGGAAARRRCRASSTRVPLIEGQVMASTPHAGASARLVRGMREDGLKALPLIANNIRFGTLDGFDGQEGIAIGTRLANLLRVTVGDTVTLVSPRGAVDALRHRAAHQALQGGRRSSRWACPSTTAP